MVLHRYTIHSQEEYDYSRYIFEKSILYTEEEVSKKEWIEIVEKAFEEVKKDDEHMDVEQIGQYIVNNDSRFKMIDDLFKDVGTTFLDKDWQNGFDIIQEEIKC